MKIRPKNILSFQNGGVPQWYLDRYGNRTSLLGWDLNKRYNYANTNLNTNDHRNAGNLDTVYQKNIAYTGTPGAISSDIQAFYDSDGNGMSAEDFVNFYNTNAAKIRSHWAQDQTYNAKTAGEHNRLFRKMFQSRSNTSASPGSAYNIGYQDNLEDIEGSSTWLRRMDQYENEFDPNNPNSDRLHNITLKDGTVATVYKKANGDIGLLQSAPQENPQQNPSALYSITGQHNDNYGGFDWKKIGEGLKQYGPDLLAAGRLAGNLWNNDRVFREQLEGLQPVLKGTYNTYRQVTGDEGSKQAYYRRAAQGQTKAAQPFTADSDRQMAYQQEAKRIGDELRAQGDLIDNQEIRRTSDESNQHQWANAQRAREIANFNRESMITTDKLRHDLKAAWKSANWTSIDNELLARETRMRQKQAKNEAIRDQIYALDAQQKLLNDDEYNRLYTALSNAWDEAVEKHGENNIAAIKNDPKVKAAQQAFKNRQYQLQRQQLEGMLNYAKSGIKITHKKKDDLLYKTARDAAEHYRKMVKITSDSNNRRRIKIDKLTSHPKGNTRKYQQGGVAPFTIYRPAVVGGETTTSTAVDTTSGRTSSKKGSDKNETLDMIKELFKSVAGKGLQSDVNTIYSSMNSFLAKASMFGEELSTDDIASMYLSNMQKLNQIQLMKEDFDKAREIAINNDAMNEFAVDAYGDYIVQDAKTKEIKSAGLNEIKEGGLNPLTNEQLLNIRNYSPEYAFNTNLIGVVANGIGMSKIAEFLKSNLPKLGTDELVMEGYTHHEANQIKQGLESLAEAPTGDYKYTQKTKSQAAAEQKALAYLAGILPRNMKAVLNMHAYSEGISPDLLLKTLVGSDTTTYQSLEFDAVTGKAAKDKNGNGTGDNNDMIPALAFFNGLGEKETFIIQDKTSDGLKINTISAPITLKGSNTGSITFDKLQSSDFGGQLNMNQATMGDALISSSGRQNIIIDGRIYQAELPIDQSAKNNEGIIKPDLKFLKNIEAADQELKNMGIDKSDVKNVQKINEIYKKHNLPILYTISNNKLTITSNYARFAIVNGIGTEDAFGESPEFNDGIQEISGDKERQQFEQFMQQQSNNSKYKLNNGYGLFGINFGETKLYKGTIYIPMVNSNISALGGTGYKEKGEEYNQIEAQQQAADAAREMGFNPAGDASNL